MTTHPTPSDSGVLPQTNTSLPIPFVDLVHQWWDAWWKHLDMYPDLECDVTSTAFTIVMPNTRVYLFNLHERLEQMWLSSPISGGHHFVYHMTIDQSPDGAVKPTTVLPKPWGQWLDTRTNQRLQDMVMQEWRDHYAIDVPWLG